MVRSSVLRAYAGIVLGIFVLLSASPVRAADPQGYDVTIGKTGIGELDDALSASSLLVGLRTKAPAGPFALVARAKSDIGRLEETLQSFGYYQATLAITIDHRPLSDLGLADRLDAIPKGTPVPVDIQVVIGPVFHLRHVSIDGAMPPSVSHSLDIGPGDPAVAAKILAAGTSLLTALEEHGYALAKVEPPDAMEDDADHAIDVSFKVTAGPQARIGAIAFKGLHDVHESFARRALTIHSGDLYQPGKIEAARRALLALGVFSGVSAHAADHVDGDGSIALTFEVQERKKHAVTFGGAYSTDLGVSLSATWSDRNLLGNAEQLNLSAAGTDLGGTATTGLGYNLSAQFIEPQALSRRDDLEFDLTGIKQQFIAYDQTAETIAGYVRRKLSPEWKLSAGLSLTQEQVLQENVTYNYQLVAVPVSATLDSTGLTDLLQDPTHGFRANLAVTPTQSFGHSGSRFATLLASGATYFDLAKSGSSVIAVRGLVGSVIGAGQFDLPPDERLYAGGSGTIRGYKYQSVGPLFADGNPIGGTALDAGSVEFRQRLFDDWGAAAFVDAGQASAETEPFTGTVRVGAGAGVRYYTPIGPVRLDIALPVTPVPHGDAFELYIGLGQAF
ncbi:MAG: autotransporter assembly complex family protein [Rhizomicrobium sp.]